MQNEGKRFRVLFAGTPTFALPSLEALGGIPEIEIVAVLTQPDKPVGRNKEPLPSPVKKLARDLGFPVFQPTAPQEIESNINPLKLDLAVLVAYGFILPPSVLEIPRLGWLNVHASLLPRWRGAAPIAHAILAGDEITGITLIKLDKGVDTGPILARRSIPIEPADTTIKLVQKLSMLGADLLAKTVVPFLQEKLDLKPQPSEGVTLAPKLTKEMGIVDWQKPAIHISRMVRALQPWPGVKTVANGKGLKLLEVELLGGETSGPPGSMRIGTEGTTDVACGSGWLRLKIVQLESRRPMPAEAFVRGYRQLLDRPLGQI